MPFYAEECASMLAVTFSGGDKMLRSIVSASWVPTRSPWPVPPPPLPSQACALKPAPDRRKPSRGHQGNL